MMFSAVQETIDWGMARFPWQFVSTVPKRRPDEFCSVSREGGRFEVGIDRPVIACQFWAQSPARAEEMALSFAFEVAKTRMQEIDGVYRADVTGCYDFADPDSGSPRWQVSLELVTVTR